MTTNQQILLKSRPTGIPTESDFELRDIELPELKQGQFLIKNEYLPLDAGFRQWMNEGSGDNYLPAMPLGEAVQSIVLGRVVDSRHADYPTGTVVMGRTAWELYSIADGSDLMMKIDADPDISLHEYVCALGPAGMTAYFGLLDVGKPKPGDTVLISAAAGGIGAFVGQIARIKGCRVVGISGSDEKCRWLETDLGFDATVNYKLTLNLAGALSDALPNGANIVFDNVGGTMLDEMLLQLAEGARVVLCGAVSQYDREEHQGIRHLWQLVTKRAKAEGFMFSDYVDRFPAAMKEIGSWVKTGQLKSPATITQGLESTPRAFADMLSGRSRGKALVKVA